jgi:hypothetical protein
LILPRAMPVSQLEFRVIWEIEIEADCPKEAVQRAREVQLRPDMPATVFEVWDHARQKLHRVDLAEPIGRLDDAALASLRSTFRRLQCAPDLSFGSRDVVSVMLVFLDAEQRHAKHLLPERP